MNASNGPILVPLDGTPASECALPGSAALARRLGGALRLVYVIDPDGKRDGAATDVSAYLEQVSARTRAQGVSCDGVVGVGDAVDVVLHEAERSAARYVSIARGDPFGRDDRVGSTPFRRLLRESSVPVLVWGDARECSPVRPVDLDGPIVVPLDGSEAARRALAEAVPLARALGVGVVLVCAVVPQATLSDFAPIDLGSTLDEGEAAILHLRVVGRSIKADGVPALTTIRYGTPGLVIAETATRERASLVVMTTHARSGLSRLLLGSVAGSVVHQAGCPVLLIGPRARANARDSFPRMNQAA